MKIVAKYGNQNTKICNKQIVALLVFYFMSLNHLPQFFQVVVLVGGFFEDFASKENFMGIAY